MSAHHQRLLAIASLAEIISWCNRHGLVTIYVNQGDHIVLFPQTHCLFEA